MDYMSIIKTFVTKIQEFVTNNQQIKFYFENKDNELITFIIISIMVLYGFFLAFSYLFKLSYVILFGIMIGIFLKYRYQTVSNMIPEGKIKEHLLNK
jgi:hypothetical protein